jgi:hypothetical protein
MDGFAFLSNSPLLCRDDGWEYIQIRAEGIHPQPHSQPNWTRAIIHSVAAPVLEAGQAACMPIDKQLQPAPSAKTALL